MNIFSKQHTSFVKGVAVLFLLFHHLFFTSFTLPIRTFDFYGLLTCLTKVCVALFTILSGYGLTISYQNKKVSDAKFVFIHIRKLLTNYWWVFVPVFILSFKFNANGTPIEIYGTGFKGVLYGILDFTGLRGITYTPTLTNTWWFVGAILVYYTIFPLIYKAVHKFPIVSILISSIPCIVDIFVIFTKTSDRELYYFLPFAVGVVFADKEVLNKAVEWSDKKKVVSLVLSFLAIIISAVIVTQVRLIGNVLYACSIIFFCIAFKTLNVKPINKILEFYGKYSMDIYYAHPFLYSIATFAVIGNLIQSLPNPIFKYIGLAILSIVVAIVIELVKKCFYKIISEIKAKSNDNKA